MKIRWLFFLNKLTTIELFNLKNFCGSIKLTNILHTLEKLQNSHFTKTALDTTAYLKESIILIDLHLLDHIDFIISTGIHFFCVKETAESRHRTSLSLAQRFISSIRYPYH